MPTPAKIDPRICKLEVTDEAIVAHMVDGRVVSVPLEWSWRLAEATPAERNNFRLAHDGYCVHWPDIDEDLSAQGMLTGTPAPRPGSSSNPKQPRKRVRVAKKSPPAKRRRSAGA
jgi:hypothetical protein